MPGFDAVRSMTVENAWQFLKMWPDEDGWHRDRALEAFSSTCAIRYPRGKVAKAVGHHWEKDGSALNYVEARRRIYAPCYLEMLQRPDRAAIIERLRSESAKRQVLVWDPDSYDVRQEGLPSIVAAVDYTAKPFAHAFLVALAVDQKLGELGI